MMRLPPPKPHGFTLATPGARFLARLTDIAALLGINVLVNGWFAYQWWIDVQPFLRVWTAQWMSGTVDAAELPDLGQAQPLFFAILFIGLALWFAYEVPATANSGQTFGKWLLRVKVMRIESTEAVGFGRSWRRWNPLAVPTLLWQCCGIGLLIQAVDCLFVAIDRPLHQAIHDKSAGTVVVAVAGPKRHRHRAGAPPEQTGDPDRQEKDHEPTDQG